MSETPDPRPMQAALAVLITLQTGMLAALFTQTVPHPPIAIAPFALAPFLSAAIATALAAVILAGRRAGTVLALIAGLLALVSFGPHKYVDAAFPLIWPAVIAAQISVVALIGQAVKGSRPLHRPGPA